ncbi:MAG: DUF58 domain-containing protein [Kurthia sp.]|nr:DUF58 domain-containing protein [Candidatus Kurthia equi]
MKKILLTVVLLLGSIVSIQPAIIFLLIGWLFWMAASYVSKQYIKNKVSMTLITENEIKRNQNTSLKIEVSNKGYLPITDGLIKLIFINNRSHEQMKMEIPFSVQMKSTEKLDVDLSFNDFGEVEIIGEKFIFGGLFTSEKNLDNEKHVLVLPMIYTVGFTNSMLKNLHAAETGLQLVHASEHSDENLGIRPYRVGDEIRQIHWKLSAKTDEFVVVIPQKKIDCRLIVCLEMASATTEEETILTEVFLSVVQQLVLENQKVSIWINNEERQITRNDMLALQYDIMHGQSMGIVQSSSKQRLVITNSKLIQERYKDAIRMILEPERTTPWSFTPHNYINDLKLLGRKTNDSH